MLNLSNKTLRRIRLLLYVILIVWASRLLVNSFRKQIIEPFTYSFNFPFISKPRVSDGDKFYLRTLNGKYITACGACRPEDANIDNRCSVLLCLKDEPRLSSQFHYHRHRDGTFSVETAEGKYWKRCAKCVGGEGVCPNVICADGINPNLQPHKFELIKNRDGTVSIRTDVGRLLEVTHGCGQTCGPVITSLGLNDTSRFHLEIIEEPPKRLEVSKDYLAALDKLPQRFPVQYPYNNY